jgi:hypothetical protein
MPVCRRRTSLGSALSGCCWRELPMSESRHRSGRFGRPWAGPTRPQKGPICAAHPHARASRIELLKPSHGEAPTTLSRRRQARCVVPCRDCPLRIKGPQGRKVTPSNPSSIGMVPARPRCRAPGASGVGGRARLPNSPALDSDAAGWLVAAVEHIWIEVDVRGPLDRPGLRVDTDLLEHVTTIPDRREHSAGREQSAHVDLLDRAVGEGHPQAVALEGFHTSVILLSWFMSAGRPVPLSRGGGHGPSCAPLVAVRVEPFSH